MNKKNAALLAGLGSKDETKKEEIKLDKSVVLANFDFSQIEAEEREFLENQTVKIQGATSKMYTELGKIFTETQEKLSNNKSGIFEQWYTVLGFKKNAVYRLVSRYKYIVANCNDKILIESLPISLSYEVTKESCNKELRELVLNGEIKTLKEFMEYKELCKEKENKKVKAIEYNEVLPGAIEELEKLNIDIKKSYETIKEENKPKLLKLIEKFEKELKKILE